jgi:cytochrome P450
MAVAAPKPVSFNPVLRLARDIYSERAWERPPPGPREFSLSRTRAFARNPLPILLGCHRRYGPVFSIRILHSTLIFMLGPEANHHILVSHADNFRWREGGFGDLMPLLGDGMLTIDGDYHRRSRRVMLPAFHRDRLAASVDTMAGETLRALEAWRPGDALDLYHWTRALALRIAMRALFGFDPDRTGGDDLDPAVEFEHALGYYGSDYVLQTLRGPLTPWARMHTARRRLDRLIYAEIARRRAADDVGEDILSMLLEADDEDGWRLSDREVRDHVMTLLFAGHDTTTSTVTFLFYELARHPRTLARILDEQDRVLGGRAPSPEELIGGALPELEMALEETLRIYPPAWVGPRRAVEAFEFAGQHVPAGAPVHYSSWASHHLPEVFEEPEAFVPERFTAEAKAALPKGAYVPFGGGSRTCVGMRFGQLEIRTIATLILQRFRLSLEPGHRMTIRQMPTLSPREGLPVVVRERGVPDALAGAAGR